jgi:hypothetical protein
VEDLGEDGRNILKWTLRITCKIVDRICLAQDRDQYRPVMNMLKKSSCSIKGGEFLDCLGNC